MRTDSATVASVWSRNTTTKNVDNANIFSRIQLLYTQLGSVQDTLVISAAGLGGTSTAYAAMVWQESY